MNHLPTRSRKANLLCACLLASWLGGCARSHHHPGDTAATRVDRVSHQGWPGAWRLRNDEIEAIIVPAVGRVMSFRRLGGENVFWEDVSLAGQRGDASGKEWVNFGGDKTWPAPEAEWGRHTGSKQWMPPPGFDGLPATAHAEGPVVVLISPVDPFYAIRTIRRIRLETNSMFITTTYERVSGEPLRVGIWVITQFTEPVAVQVPLTPRPMFPGGYFIFQNEPWPQLRRERGQLVITRDRARPHKMGCDADELIWIGPHDRCVVRAPRLAGAEYPDGGASAEVYTNPDPKPYVELELLSPLRTLTAGQSVSFTQSYTLSARK